MSHPSKIIDSLDERIARAQARVLPGEKILGYIFTATQYGFMARAITEATLDEVFGKPPRR